MVRTRRLHEGRRKIAQQGKEYDCARRLSLIFFHHEVDEARCSVSESLLRQGTSKNTLAYEKLARELLVGIQVVKDDRSYSRSYVQLLKRSGPGDLLDLGDGVSTM